MAFRLPNAKKFKPSVKGPVARKASIPASLAKSSSQKSTQPSQPSQPSQSPATASASLPTQEDGLPPSIGAPATAPDGGVPTIGSSQPGPSATPTFREPSLPPPSSRPRAASPTPSNASHRSSRTGGRPTLIHLAASTGSAKRPDASPSPAPPARTAGEQEPAASASASATSGPATLSAPRPARISQSPAAPATAPLSKPRPAPVVPPRTSVTPRATPRALPTPTPPPPAQRQRSSVPPPSASPLPAEPSGLPPMIGASMIDPALLDQTPGAGPSRERAAELAAERAAELIADIAEQPRPPVKPKPRLTMTGMPMKKPGPAKGQKGPSGKDTNWRRQRRKERLRASASAAAEAVTEANAEETEAASATPDGEVPDATPEPAAAPPATPAKKKRKPRKQPTPQYDSDGEVIRIPRPDYKSRGKWGTDRDGRLRHNREAKLAERQAENESAEDIPIDPELQKMGSFTRGYYEGDMTERAVKLKEAQRIKREDAQKEKVEFERQKRIRLQPLRRRERAKRNEDRAQRRVEWEAAGSELGPTEVSDDEADSTDEEYDFEPDRLTPPGTPEPDDFMDPFGNEDGEEHLGGDDEEEQEGLGDVEAPEEDEEEAEDDEGDHEPAEPVDLGEHGFNIAEDQDDGTVQERDPNEEDPDTAALFDINPDDMDPDADMDDDGQPGYSYADYAANMEARRAQALATQNTRFVVQEDDDELRMVNTTTWQKRAKTDKWTDDETDFFYSVLGEVGENYGLMKAFFPGRTIAQIKKKGLRENAKNPEKVTAAINARKPIDNQYLRKSAGYDPNRPWDKEEALFAEAKRDMLRLRAEDRGEEPPEDEEMAHDGFGDETMDFDADAPLDDGGQAGEEQNEGDEIPALDPEALFLPHDEEEPETPRP